METPTLFRTPAEGYRSLPGAFQSVWLVVVDQDALSSTQAGSEYIPSSCRTKASVHLGRVPALFGDGKLWQCYPGDLTDEGGFLMVDLLDRVGGSAIILTVIETPDVMLPCVM